MSWTPPPFVVCWSLRRGPGREIYARAFDTKREAVAFNTTLEAFNTEQQGSSKVWNRADLRRHPSNRMDIKRYLEANNGT